MVTRPQPGVSQDLSMIGLREVVSPTMSWDFSAQPLESVEGMIVTPRLSPYSFAISSAFARSRSHRYIVLICGRATWIAETIVRPMTPAPTSVAVVALEGAVYFAMTPPTAEVRIAVMSVPSRMQNGSTVSGSLRMEMSMP